jgi:hypothetical protein
MAVRMGVERAVSNDDDRARGVRDAMLGNRPQEETGQLSAALTAEHEEVGADCCFEECHDWGGLHHLGGVLDAWGIAENRGDRLGQDSLSIYEKVVVIVDRREWVADREVPGHEDVEWAACQGRCLAAHVSASTDGGEPSTPTTIRPSGWNGPAAVSVPVASVGADGLMRQRTGWEARRP